MFIALSNVGRAWNSRFWRAVSRSVRNSAARLTALISPSRRVSASFNSGWSWPALTSCICLVTVSVCFVGSFQGGPNAGNGLLHLQFMSNDPQFLCGDQAVLDLPLNNQLGYDILLQGGDEAQSDPAQTKKRRSTATAHQRR